MRLPFDLLEKLRMGTGSNEEYYTVLSAVIKPINQKKIATDMTFTMPGPISDQSMIKPLLPQRGHHS